MTTTAEPNDSLGGRITVRYWASARAAVGVDTDVIVVAGPVSLAWLTTEVVRLHPVADRLGEVLQACSPLVGDQPVASEDPCTVQVTPGETVEFLPPFAGG